VAIEVFGSVKCSVQPAGWFRLASGLYMTCMPFWDGDAGLFCRKGAADFAAMLAPLGMRLPTAAEYIELHKQGVHIEPVELPTPEMVAAAGVPKPWVNADGSDTTQMAAYRGANMASRAWCEMHDREVFKRLGAVGWRGEPVDNAGKHFCNDGGIIGWWRSNGTMVQPLSYWHEPGDVPNVPPKGQQRDYASTCHAVALKEPSNVGPSKSGLFPSALESPRSRALGALAGLGVAAAASAVLYFYA